VSSSDSWDSWDSSNRPGSFEDWVTESLLVARAANAVTGNTKEAEGAEEAEEVTLGEQDSSWILRVSLIARIEWLTILPRRSSSKKPSASRLLFGFFGPFDFFEQTTIICGLGDGEPDSRRRHLLDARDRCPDLARPQSRGLVSDRHLAGRQAEPVPSSRAAARCAQ
jgi:hypothetical protein